MLPYAGEVPGTTPANGPTASSTAPHSATTTASLSSAGTSDHPKRVGRAATTAWSDSFSEDRVGELIAHEPSKVTAAGPMRPAPARPRPARRWR
ncbi:hypothetical protein GCM10029964_113850 [Kibdelosporangium lantanae]